MDTRPKTITIDQDHYALLNKYAHQYINMLGSLAADTTGADTSAPHTPKIGALPVSTTTRLSAQDIETQINHLVEDTARHRRNFNKTFGDHTAEGNRKLWGAATSRSRERVNQLRTLIDRYGKAVAERKATARARLTPTTDDPQAQVAAELAYQRIMSRPAVKNAKNPVEAVMGEVMALGPSPARTLILDEMTARGEISAQTVDALFASTDEEYAAACTSETLAAAYKANLTGKLDQVEERLVSTPTDGVGGFSLSWPVPVDAPTQAGLCEAEVAYTLPTTIPMYDGPTVQDLS